VFDLSPQSFITDFLHKPQFMLYDWQSAFIEELRIPQYAVHGVVKGRQIGFTSIFVDYAFWKSFRYVDHHTLIITTDQCACKYVMQLVYKRIDTFIDQEHFNLALRRYHDEVIFKNGSSIKVISSSLNVDRDERTALLIFDEAAFMRNLKEMWLSLFPAMSTEGQVILASTPSGKNEFYGRIEGLRSSNAFIVHTIPSSIIHSQQWLDNVKMHIPSNQYRAEHECEFI